MKFKSGTRTRIRLDMTLDFDPTGSDLELLVDGQWRPCQWEGASSENTELGTWTQSARTINYFAGPDITPAGAVVLARGRHDTATRITSGPDVIYGVATPIEVG